MSGVPSTSTRQLVVAVIAALAGFAIGAAAFFPAGCGVNGHTVCKNIFGIELPFRTWMVIPALIAGVLGGALLVLVVRLARWRSARPPRS